jgi:glycosyltransferase involved in cell wall biosynthesis
MAVNVTPMGKRLVKAEGLRKSARGLSLLAWAYNEEQLVEGFLERAVSLLEETVDDYEVVFVDDGSTDETGALADAFARTHPMVRVIHHPQNLNVGMACRTAVAHARKDYLLWQTVDWSYDLTNLRLFLELLDYYDVVQGVRPVPIRLLSYIPVVRSIYRVRSRSDNIRKALVSLINYYVLRILFGVRFHDFQNVTIYPRRLVQSFAMRGRTSFVNPEFLIRSYAAGAGFIEVPISFIKRSAGKAKGTKLRTILRAVIDIAGNWLQWGWRFRLGGRLAWAPHRIERVSAPFALREPVLRICVAMFREFDLKSYDGPTDGGESMRAKVTHQH